MVRAEKLSRIASPICAKRTASCTLVLALPILLLLLLLLLLFAGMLALEALIPDEYGAQRTTSVLPAWAIGAETPTFRRRWRVSVIPPTATSNSPRSVMSETNEPQLVCTISTPTRNSAASARTNSISLPPQFAPVESNQPSPSPPLPP